jgi:hypothetical protein
VSKISELSDGGSLVSSDYLIAVRSGGNVKVRMDQINVDQVDLGDNEFIRLGNSQDLTMVHTSTQSIINQAGIGDLLIQKAGATKLTINATGIDVTGTVTASAGITATTGTFSGNIGINGGSTTYPADIKVATDTKLLIQQGNTAGNAKMQAVNNGVTLNVPLEIAATSLHLFTGGTEKVTIASTGAVTFSGNITKSVAPAANGGIVVNDGTNDLIALGSGGFSANGGLATDGGIRTAANFVIATGAGSPERMRIDTSGNVGIGCTPNWGIQTGNFRGSASAPVFSGTSGDGFAFDYYNGPNPYPRHGSIAVIGAGTATADMSFWTDSGSAVVERMRIDASGNLGIGVVPSAWGTGSGVRGLEVGANLAASQDINSVYFSANAYNSATGWKYRNTQYASNLRMGTNDGVFQFQQAASGTAGAAITWATSMTLDASGNLGINNSNPSAFDSLGGKSLVFGNGVNTSNLTLFSDDTAGANAYGHVAFADSAVSSSTAQYAGLIQYYHGEDSMRFYTNATEKMRIDTSGHAIIPAGVTLGTAAGVYAAANTLDDYEEGTWVPTPSAGTFSSTSCSYTKVGRLVTLLFDVVVGTGGGSTMQAPITAGSTTAAAIYTSLQDFSAGRTVPTIVIGGGSTTMYFRDIGDNASATGFVLTAGATITFTLSYITA